MDERRVGAPRIDITPQPQKSFLRHIFGLGAITQHTIAIGYDSAQILIEQQLGSTTITGRDPKQQGRIAIFDLNRRRTNSRRNGFISVRVTDRRLE